MKNHRYSSRLSFTQFALHNSNGLVIVIGLLINYWPRLCERMRNKHFFQKIH
jgi:hypothetical protein